MRGANEAAADVRLPAIQAVDLPVSQPDEQVRRATNPNWLGN